MGTQEVDVHHGLLIDWNPVLALLSTDDLASVSDSLIDVEGIVHYE